MTWVPVLVRGTVGRSHTCRSRAAGEGTERRCYERLAVSPGSDRPSDEVGKWPVECGGGFGFELSGQAWRGKPGRIAER